MESRDPENARILGLETEVIVAASPDVASSEDASTLAASTPAASTLDASSLDASTLEERVLRAVLRNRVYGHSATPAGGAFLENGGLAHLERSIASAPEPILEVSTPECRSPWALLLQARAMDRIIETAMDDGTASEPREGAPRRLRFVKASRDSRGVGVGCHENYMAHDRPGPADRRRRRLAAPVILACHLIALFLAVVERAAWRVAAAVWHLWTRARGRPPREFLGAWPPEPWPAPKTGLQRALGWVSSGVILATRLPLILVLDRVARRTALCAARAALAPLLATRSLVAGCGSLNFDAGVYELSQRAPFVRRHSGVRMPGSSRMLYHLKRHAIDPRHVFAPLQRLVIVCGDANLSDVPILLKAGTTCLILEMVEAGETFPELELADPVRALREASLGGPWKQLALRRGGTITALDVQKGYLARAKAFFANRLEGDRLRPRELLALWEECLDLVERHDPACAETFDWAAKRALLDAAILPKTTWKAFFAWGRALHQAGDEAVAAARDFPDLARRASWRGRWRLRRAMRGARLDPTLFPAMRDLYLQARKIDLRYHELSPEGYQRTLEAQGLIRRIVTDEAIDQATRTPPADTRARIRSFYIRRSADPAYVFADWDELWLRHPPLHVDLADPFFARIPTDPWERPEA